MLKRVGLLVAGCFILCSISSFAFAAKSETGMGQWINEIGVFGGFTEGDLKAQDNLKSIPMGMRIGFDLKPFTEKFDFSPPGYLQFIVEPFMGTIIDPKTNVEMGCGFILRYSYPLTKKIYPYIEAGPGLYYMTIDTYEQGTQFNFFEAGGVGISYFIRDDMAINISYRYRHVSNAGIDEPNGGIESSHYLIGVSKYF